MSRQTETRERRKNNVYDSYLMVMIIFFSDGMTKVRRTAKITAI